MVLKTKFSFLEVMLLYANFSFFLGIISVPSSAIKVSDLIIVEKVLKQENMEINYF